MAVVDTTAAVVTGAARGFGLEIARRLAARGHRVLITDVDAAGVARAAAELGPAVTATVADARDPEAHRRVAREAARLGRVAVWVNNAGVAVPGKAWEPSDGDVERLVGVNLLGVVHGARAAVEAMRDGGGHLLNLGSLSGLGPVPGLAVYAATKAAVVNFTASLQGDLDAAGIPVRAHVLCPHAADTALVRAAQPDPDSAILFTQRTLLDAGRVADAALALLDGRRVVRSLPVGWAAATRLGAVLPTATLRAMRALRVLGERRRTAGPSR